MIRRQDLPFADRNTAITQFGERITTTLSRGACREGPPTSGGTPPAPLPPAGVVARCFGGGAAAADGCRSDGRPSATEKAATPAARGLGATACAGGGGGRHAQNLLRAPVSAAKYTGSSSAWPPASGHTM